MLEGLKKVFFVCDWKKLRACDEKWMFCEMAHENLREIKQIGH